MTYRIHWTGTRPPKFPTLDQILMAVTPFEIRQYISHLELVVSGMARNVKGVVTIEDNSNEGRPIDAQTETPGEPGFARFRERRTGPGLASETETQVETNKETK